MISKQDARLQNMNLLKSAPHSPQLQFRAHQLYFSANNDASTIAVFSQAYNGFFNIICILDHSSSPTQSLLSPTMTDLAPQNAPTPKPFTIAICGGGIAGLALAIGHLRHNVPFHLYESAHAFAEVGAGVSFGPNSLRAMSLIDPKIRKEFDKGATSNAQRR